MCARYVIKSPPDAVRALFGYEERPNFPPRYNIAPTQPIAIVRLVDGQRTNSRWCAGVCCRPGSRIRRPSRCSSTRAESPCRQARLSRRHETAALPDPGRRFLRLAGGRARKRPFYVHAKSGEPLAFAGLWETWTGPNGEELDTAAIVTTRANKTLAPIYERMPVIVPPEAFDLWLNAGEVDAATAAALIAPAPDGLLEAYEISTAVNRTANDSADLMAPAPAGTAGDAQAPAKTPPAPAKPRSRTISRRCSDTSRKRAPSLRRAQTAPWRLML